MVKITEDRVATTKYEHEYIEIVITNWKKWTTTNILSEKDIKTAHRLYICKIMQILESYILLKCISFQKKQLFGNVVIFWKIHIIDGGG